MQHEDDPTGDRPDEGGPPATMRPRRRDVIKLGAAAVMSAVGASRVQAQEGARQGAAWPPPVRTRAGYVYDAKRQGNGPMDESSRKIVQYVRGFSEKNLTDADIAVLNKIMLDAMAALVTGFEEPHVRRTMRLALQVLPGTLKCTVLGYGLPTSPEMAAFLNSVLIRATDFNDLGPGSHVSDMIPAALSLGEALHKSGLEVLNAVALAYELRAAPGTGGETACGALVAGKLMGLSEDELANALTMAITPHVTLNKGEGAMSMWKGLRSAEPLKCGVWGALMAREGITGPPQPFEGEGALWSLRGRTEVRLPAFSDGRLALHRMGFKRYPSEGSSQAVLDLIPEMRAWTTVDDIESIHHTLGAWGEIASPPMWDPWNRETADHSMPYILARALMDGEIYLNSFTEEKYRDPKCLQLMQKITMSYGHGFSGNAPAQTTIRKKSGEERTWDTQGGRRQAPAGEILSKPAADHRLTMEEVVAKFNRACDYKRVATEQRDRARAIWSNLRNVSDIGEAMQTLAKFGNPQPL
jgi:2-methylcitrate dehydratase